MSFKHNEHSIKKAFDVWINNYPESFHPLDMQRFYTFVKTVCQYSRKPKDGEWLKNKITQSKNSLEEEDIQIYCDKFEELQKFYKAMTVQVYDY